MVLFRGHEQKLLAVDVWLTSDLRCYLIEVGNSVLIRYVIFILSISCAFSFRF